MPAKTSIIFVMFSEIRVNSQCYRIVIVVEVFICWIRGKLFSSPPGLVFGRGILSSPVLFVQSFLQLVQCSNSKQQWNTECLNAVFIVGLNLSLYLSAVISILQGMFPPPSLQLGVHFIQHHLNNLNNRSLLLWSQMLWSRRYHFIALTARIKMCT